jgi:hypothetical protein
MIKPITSGAEIRSPIRSVAYAVMITGATLTSSAVVPASSCSSAALTLVV